jgi:hypothetical protein
MSAPPEPSTRIFGIVAREASRVVLLRRGPSKHVLAITWDTIKHQFHVGQWLKGRIYEHRCDLSPSGERLVYLAANNKPPLYAWTAVSRPPFLTALALWKNCGTWGGGGLFDHERALALNSGGRLKPEDGFHLPKGFTVKPIASWAGGGEDDPVRTKRMLRDGWTLDDEGSPGEYQRSGRFNWEYLRPQRWSKVRRRLRLERRVLGIGEQNGPWYTTEHRVFGENDEIVLDLGLSDWADWSRSDELLFARDGRVYRAATRKDGVLDAPEELIDLRPLRFEAVSPTAEAKTWNLRVTGRRIK